MSDQPTLLVVEDDDQIAQMLTEHLQAACGARVLRTATAAQTLRLDLDESPDLMLVDLLLPDGNGLDLIRLIRSTRKYPVLLMTGQPTLGRAVEAMRLGVRDIFTKPFDLDRLTGVVRESLLQYRSDRSKDARLAHFEKLVRKVIEERKSLQERVDLVCRDLVGAYRDLAQRVTQQSEWNRHA